MIQPVSHTQTHTRRQALTQHTHTHTFQSFQKHNVVNLLRLPRAKSVVPVVKELCEALPSWLLHYFTIIQQSILTFSLHNNAFNQTNSRKNITM